jgi:hypothetical protein
MYLTFHCPTCGRECRTTSVGACAVLSCASGDWMRDVSASDVTDDAPRRCLVCGNRDLWRQKDFPQRLGLVIVAAGAILSSVLWYHHRPVLALGLLMGFALVDMVLFLVMPDVLVCYRCQARHHSAGRTEAHAAFNHELGERYRQEALRLKDSQGVNPV